MTHDQIIREEFERWWIDANGGNCIVVAVNTSGAYIIKQTDFAWQTWQAAWSVAAGYSA